MEIDHNKLLFDKHPHLGRYWGTDRKGLGVRLLDSYQRCFSTIETRLSAPISWEPAPPIKAVENFYFDTKGTLEIVRLLAPHISDKDCAGTLSAAEAGHSKEFTRPYSIINYHFDRLDRTLGDVARDIKKLMAISELKGLESLLGSKFATLPYEERSRYTKTQYLLNPEELSQLNKIADAEPSLEKIEYTLADKLREAQTLLNIIEETMTTHEPLHGSGDEESINKAKQAHATCINLLIPHMREQLYKLGHVIPELGELAKMPPEPPLTADQIAKPLFASTVATFPKRCDTAKPDPTVVTGETTVTYMDVFRKSRGPDKT